MEEPKCSMCIYFRQHYIHWDADCYYEVPCGHCVYPRLKHRKPDTPACIHFHSRQEQKDKSDQ